VRVEFCGRRKKENEFHPPPITGSLGFGDFT